MASFTSRVLDHKLWNSIVVSQGEEGGQSSDRAVDLALGLVLPWELGVTHDLANPTNMMLERVTHDAVHDVISHNLFCTA